MSRSAGWLGCGLALLALLAGTAGPAQAQSITGRWEHDGPFGVSFVHFHPPVRLENGTLEGYFNHHIFLDQGRVIRGRGTYILSQRRPNQGHLVLIFNDGHRTGMHEHTFGHNVLVLEHHGIRRTYTRRSW